MKANQDFVRKVNETVASWLVESREDVGMTCEEAAYRIDITPQRLREYEDASASISVAELALLAIVYHADATNLISFIESSL